MLPSPRSGFPRSSAPRALATALLTAAALALLAPTCDPGGEGSGSSSPRSAAQGDLDGDGWLDLLDGCPKHADRFQLDGDRDGAGNACDADYDNDGIVGQSDLERLVAALGTRRGERGYDALCDHDGDGLIGPLDFVRLMHLFGRDPLAALDGDGDGLRDHSPADRCPGTRAGGRMAGFGCSLLDLVARPEMLFDPLFLLLDGLVEPFAAAPDLAEVRREVGATRGGLEDALAAAQWGEPCEAARLATLATEPLQAAVRDVEAQQRVAEANVPVPAPAEDVSPEQMLVEELHFVAARLNDAIDRVAEAAALEGEACDGTGAPTTLRGTVAELDEGRRRIVLADGRELHFRALRTQPAPGSGYEELHEGVEIRIDGIATEDGQGGLAFSVGPAVVPADQPEIEVPPCLRLRVAPVQRFPPAPEAGVGGYELHDPEAYERDGVYRLDRGARVAAESTCPPADLGEFARFALRVEYTLRKGQASEETSVLALDLDEHDVPVPIPFPSSVSANDVLVVTLHEQSCTGGPSGAVCGPKSVVSVAEYPVLPAGLVCAAEYASSLYDVDDQIPDDFRVARLSGLDLNAFAVGPVSFGAEGYAAIPPALPLLSSFPTVLEIVGEQPFALHNTDFWPIHGPSNPWQQLYLSVAAGVDRAAGLRWPHIRGTHGGHEYRYRCELPDVVRDVVNFCPAETTDAFYRLPFPEGDTSWSQGQGNDGSFSHSGGFAYDMAAPLDEPIHAARSGRVIWAKEDESQQCGCATCPGAPVCPVVANQVWVRHQDGTFGQYVHPPQNGIVVEDDDVVQRGQQLAVVGVTGNTTGPHLHLAQKTMLTLNGSTALALFEALDPDDTSQLLTCYEPPNIESGPFVPLRSNNQPFP